MKCTIPEISWHNRGPVLSVDLQPGSSKLSTQDTFWRLASGGTDSHVLIWHLSVNETCEATVSCVADLERHQKTVNVVRFSPSGEILASGDDESMIILWKQRESSEIPIISDDDDVINKEHWNSLKVLRGHVEDVNHLSWSPDSNFLASCSLDNSVILWSVEKGKKICILNDYAKGFPQGVSWDPMNKYVASMSSDRICRLIDINSKKTVQRVSKSKIPTPFEHALDGKIVRLFYDDTFKSYFRRLTYTPDGMLLLVPSGIIEPQESTEKISNCIHVFSRYTLREPIAVLPTHEEVTNAVRCCPVYFQLREEGPTSMVELPYRMVFAVATDNSVMIYDTQQISPIAVISNIHYTRLTDIAWSSDGRILIASSSDGYCSIIHFEEGELGEVYIKTPQIVEQKKAEVEDTKETKSKPETFLELDTDAVDIDLSQKKSKTNTNDDNDTKSPEVKKNKEEKVDSPDKQVKPMDVDNNPVPDAEDEEDFQLVLEDTVIADMEKSSTKATPPKTETVDKPVTPIAVRTPRRVQLITLSSPKGKK